MPEIHRSAQPDEGRARGWPAASAAAYTDRLASGPPAVRLDHRQHREAGLAVVVAIQPRDGHEVRNLPEEDDREERGAADATALPCDAVQPMSGGSAPGTAPTSVAIDERRFIGV